MRFIILFFMISNISFAQSSVSDKLNQDIVDGYERSRYISGGASMVFGFSSIVGSTKAFKGNKSTSQKIVGGVLGLLGVVRFIDGTVQLIKEEPGEKLAKANSLRTFSDFETASSQAKERRQIRASLAASSALAYLYLYSTDSKDFDSFIYSGSILSAVALLQFFSRSPEEMAFNEISENPELLSTRSSDSKDLRFQLVPTASGIRLDMALAF